MALAEQPLGPTGMTRGALGPGANVAQRRLASRLGGVGGAGDPEAADRGPQPGIDLSQLLFEFAGALVRGTTGADVEGQRPEFAAQALQPGLQLGLAAGEGGNANRDPLLLTPQLGQHPPRLGPLAVAGGEALLGLAATFADLGQALLELGPDPPCLGRGFRRRGGAVGAEAQLLGDQAPAQAELVALDPGPELGRFGLALQRSQVGAGLALDVEGAVEVVTGGAQLQLGPAAALAVLAEAGGLLDQQPALARLGVDDRLDPALTDHRVHLAAEVGVGEDVGDVREPATGAVEAVTAVAGAVEMALDRDFGELGRGAAIGVVDHDLDLGRAPLADVFTAGGDHVLHRGAADRSRALLAERPEDGVGDVALAGAVGADDHADAGRELEVHPLGERLEPLHRDRFQIHGFVIRKRSFLACRTTRVAVESDANPSPITPNLGPGG